MGRPVNKKYFGTLADGTNITVYAKVGANAVSEQAMILKQRSSNKFKVDDSKLGTGNEGVCQLTNTITAGTLTDNQMALIGTIAPGSGNTTFRQVAIKRLYNRTAHDFAGNRYKWTVVDDSSVSYLSLTQI